MKNTVLGVRVFACFLACVLCLSLLMACDSSPDKALVDSTATNDETVLSEGESTADEEETTEAEDTSNPTSLRVMSFNVQGSVTVKERYDAVEHHILSYAPDLLGLQEDLPTSWADGKSFQPEGYTVYGSRDTVSGVSAERVGIYVKNGINVKESGSFVLAPDGQTINISYEYVKKGGRFELSDELFGQLKLLSSYPLATDKIAINDALKNGKVYRETGGTSALLQGKRASYVVAEKEGNTVIYVNTHLMNRSQKGKYADTLANVSSNNRYVLVQTIRNIERILCFELMQEKINELKKIYPNAEVIITADFNDTRTGVLRDFCQVDGDGVWDYITRAGYQDAGLVATTNGGNLTSTWNSFFSVSQQDKLVTAIGPIGDVTGQDGRIDFCFVSKGVKVLHYETGAPYGKAGENGREYYLSDHLSIIADITIG